MRHGDAAGQDPRAVPAACALDVQQNPRRILDAFLDASYLPIRFISLAGVVTAALGVLYSLTIVASWLMHATPFSGWAPLMIVVLIVGGLIMVMLGIIGEYVWRIYDEVRKKPNYIVRHKYL